ncbi:MAG: PEP-CTERM sorting domain-containing protein [Roseibacillus sp.]
MKKLIVSLTSIGMIGSASAVLNLVPNGDFSAGGTSWGSFASIQTAGDPPVVVAETLISYPSTGGNTGGYGLVDNTAGAWGGGLVSPADFQYPGNDGIPLGDLGLVAGETYDFSMDMINISGDGLGGVKLESWGVDGGGAPTILTNSGDMPASGQSSSWANYTWSYTIDPAALAVKVVPLLTPVSNNAGGNLQSSIGFDNVGFVVIPEPSAFSLLGLGLAGLLVRRRR